MSYYTDDAVKAKLSSLNETQDSIVTVAQWLLFHKRHAVRTAELWMSKVKDSMASKRLNLVYLANEVVQQSKARKKDDFVNAFAPIIAEATAIAYKSANLDIQQKIRRVVEVWRQRGIFSDEIQHTVELRIDEIDRDRASTRKPTLGGSLFPEASLSAPQLQPLATAHADLKKAEMKVASSLPSFKSSDSKDSGIDSSTVSPPVRAAQLSSLLQSLKEAEGSVSQCMKARQALTESLETLLQENKASLAKEESQLAELGRRQSALQAEQRDVEYKIQRGISSGSDAVANDDFDPPRPDAEPLTPPPVESLTPAGSPKGIGGFDALPGFGASTGFGNDSRSRTADASDVQEQPLVKRRRLHENPIDEFAAFAEGDALGGIDPDVAAILAKD